MQSYKVTIKFNLIYDEACRITCAWLQNRKLVTPEFITLYNVNNLQAIVVNNNIVITIVNVTDYFLNKHIEKIRPSQLRGFYC
jgi:hypothetical protein